MNSPKIPRESRRGHQQELLKVRIAELEGKMADQGNREALLKQGARERARGALFQPDGTLSYVYYSAASGKRGAVLQISCKVSGLPLLRTALIVDGKDFSAVYERGVRLLADAFDVRDDEEFIHEMLATQDAFLKLRGLRLVEVKYHQVVPLGHP